MIIFKKFQQNIFFICMIRDLRGRDRLGAGFTTTYAISTYHHQRYEFEYRPDDMQHYVIKFASDLWQVRGFLCALRFTPCTNKPDPHCNLLKVVLNTKHSSPYVSNRVRLHFFIYFFLLYRTLGFMQIPDFFRSITEIVI